MKLDHPIGSHAVFKVLLDVHVVIVAASCCLQITGDGSIEVMDVGLDVDDVTVGVATRHGEGVGS